jgi:hypothetical protein
VSENWSKFGADLWASAQPIGGTDAETYLRERGISRLPGPEVLRFHPAVQHPKLKRGLPALIAQVLGGAEPSHNLTWLAADGKRKANIDKAEQRCTLGSNRGGAVCFVEPIEGKPFLIGEGIETTLTAIEATDLPGYACLGTSGLANIEWSGDVREIVLLAENDDNGANQRALSKVCPILVEKGIKVRVATPPAGFKDFNDLVDPAKEGGGPGGLVVAKMIIDAAPEWRPKRGTSAKPKEKTERTSQASFLVELAATRCELFTDSQGEAYAAFHVAHGEAEAHRETHKIRSRGFSRWLRLGFYAERGSAAHSDPAVRRRRAARGAASALPPSMERPPAH